MRDVNKVWLRGVLLGNPVFKQLEDVPYCNLRLQVITVTRTKKGWRKKPEIFNVIAWDTLTEPCKKLRKGDEIAVEGKLATYTRMEGVFFTAVYAERIIALHTKEGIIEQVDEQMTERKIPSLEEALLQTDFLDELGGDKPD